MRLLAVVYSDASSLLQRVDYSSIIPENSCMHAFGLEDQWQRQTRRRTTSLFGRRLSALQLRRCSPESGAVRHAFIKSPRSARAYLAFVERSRPNISRPAIYSPYINYLLLGCCCVSSSTSDYVTLPCSKLLGLSPIACRTLLENCR